MQVEVHFDTIFKMGSEIPMVQPIFQSSKRSQMELSKSLAILGFGSWNELEPGKYLDYVH